MYIIETACSIRSPSFGVQLYLIVAARMFRSLRALHPTVEADPFLLCINNDFETGGEADRIADELRDFLDWLFPVPAPWEQPG